MIASFHPLTGYLQIFFGKYSNSLLNFTLGYKMFLYYRVVRIFVCFEYKLLIRYMICKYCLWFCGLSVYFLLFQYCSVFWGTGTPLQYSCLENPMDGGAWWAPVHGVAKGQTQLSDFTFTFHFHALEKEMATHSSVLAWRISGTGEPGGLPSTGSHRVGHNWSDLAAAAAMSFDSQNL